ncbi:MAG: hypothetical protein KDA59_20035, partial [Planctomycetales bacterium]|nr:hypothetical protein [Planctomycetales bacterium]
MYRSVVACLLTLVALATSLHAQPLHVGFAHRDITPELRDDRPVWVAGYGAGRRATGVHDPLFARCVVLKYEQRKIALVSVDLIGLQLAETRRIRQRLDGFDYVLVASTHNHEGPDVIGLWGPSHFQRGVDDEYLSLVVQRVVQAVREADKAATPVESVRFGTATDESLVNDSRQPIVKDGTLRTLEFHGTDQRRLGVLVQWNCHPEAMGSRNTLLTADFPAATIEWLQEKSKTPVVYFSGAVGGLLAPPRGGRVKDEAGVELKEGDFAYAWRYGQMVGELTEQALRNGRRVSLTPFSIESREVALPLENPLYKAGRELGVLRREASEWTGDATSPGPPITLENAAADKALVTEVATLRLGEVFLAAVPGELYPELVTGAIQTPADPAADFPDAPAEPHVAGMMGDRP